MRSPEKEDIISFFLSLFPSAQWFWASCIGSPFPHVKVERGSMLQNAVFTVTAHVDSPLHSAVGFWAPDSAIHRLTLLIFFFGFCEVRGMKWEVWKSGDGETVSKSPFLVSLLIPTSRIIPTAGSVLWIPVFTASAVPA